jgi:hypothetical protein
MAEATRMTRPDSPRRVGYGINGMRGPYHIRTLALRVLQRSSFSFRVLLEAGSWKLFLLARRD